MEELVTIIGNTCLKHHDSGEASVNREARLIIEALKQNGYEIIQVSKIQATENDFEKIIAEEAKNGNELNAYIRCFKLHMQSIVKLLSENIEWEQSFDLFHNAVKRGTELFRELNPDYPPLTYPDLAKMINYLCDKIIKSEWTKNHDKIVKHFQNQISKKHGYENYEDAEKRASSDVYCKINFEADQKVEDFKNSGKITLVNDKPFASWLRNNNYFKSRKGEKKMYENKFIEGIFTRKALYKKFKEEQIKK